VNKRFGLRGMGSLCTGEDRRFEASELIVAQRSGPDYFRIYRSVRYKRSLPRFKRVKGDDPGTATT